MFVKQSTYDALDRKHKYTMIERNRIVQKYNALLKEWNNTVEQINNRPGAWSFIESGKVPNSAPQFSQDDIKVLIQLVHPDKHDGKASAVRLTQVLLAMRK